MQCAQVGSNYNSYPVREIAEMVHALGNSTSTVMSNYQESSFYAAPSLAGLQYAATTWPDVDSTGTAWNSSESTSGWPGELVTTSMSGQPHHVSATPYSYADKNVDLIDHLLSSSDGVTVEPYGSVFQVDGTASAAVQSPKWGGSTLDTDADGHSAELPTSPLSTCTSWFSMLTLLSGTAGGSDEYMSAASMSPESWNAPAAFNSASTASATIQVTDDAAAVGGFGQAFDLSVADLDLPRQFQASLLQAGCESVSPQSVSYPVLPSTISPRINVVESPQQLATPPTSTGWGQPSIEVSSTSPYPTDLEHFVSVLNSQLEQDSNQGFPHPRGCCATQEVPVVTRTSVAGEDFRQSTCTTGLELCSTAKYLEPFGPFHPGKFYPAGHSGEYSAPGPLEGPNVRNLSSGTRPLEFDRPEFQVSRVIGVNDAVASGRVGRQRQPRRVRTYPSGHLAFRNDSSPVLAPRGENQGSMLQTGQWRSLVAPDDSVRTVSPLSMDARTVKDTSVACPTEGMVFQAAVLSHSLGQKPKAHGRPPKVPVVRFTVNHIGMQGAPLASGTPSMPNIPNVFVVSKPPRPARLSAEQALKAEDYVMRERRRRDLMNTRFQLLESLLPTPVCRRDRNGIVEDTMQYVRDMEQRVAQLKAKAASLKESLEQRESLRQRLQLVQRQPFPASEFCATFPTGCIPIESVQSDGIFRTRWFGNMAQGLDKMPYDSKVEIILPHDRQHVAILVECRSEYGGRLYSGVLRGMHRLNLEVEQCSVVSCGDLYLCSGTCQPRYSQPEFSYEQILQQLVTLLQFYMRGI